MPSDERHLVICDNGHVTDPDEDIDTRTGRAITAQAARDAARWGRAMIEAGSSAWRVICRYAVPRAEGSPHQCRARCAPLDGSSSLHAAYLLGGQEAVWEALKETRGRRPE